MAGNLKHLLRHSGIYLIGNLLNRLGAFLLLPLYTNQLDTAEYGSLEILYSLTSVLAVLLGAGLSHATLRFYFDHEEQSKRNKVIITNFAVSMLFALIGCGLVWIWDEQATLLLLDDAAYINAFRLALLIIIFELTTEVFFAFIRAQERSVFYVGVSAAKLVVQIAATYYFLAYRDGGVEGVLIANLISVLFTWLALGSLTIRHCGLGVDMSIVKPILLYSTPFALAALINSVKGNADRFILKEYMGLEEVGIYGLAMRFALLLSFLLVEPLSKSYGPYRFSLIGKPGAELFHAAVGKYLAAAAVFVALGLSLFATDVLALMSAPEYWPAAYLIPILSAGIIAQALIYCFQTGIMIQKRTNMILYISIGSTGFNLILIITLIPLLGTYGAALSFALTISFAAWLTNRVSQKLYAVPYPFGAMFRFFLLAIGIYSLSLLLPDMHMLLGILIKGLLALTFAAGVIWLDEDVRNGVRILLNRIRGRKTKALEHKPAESEVVDAETVSEAEVPAETTEEAATAENEKSASDKGKDKPALKEVDIQL